MSETANAPSGEILDSGADVTTPQQSPAEVAHSQVTHTSQAGSMREEFIKALDDIDARDAAEAAESAENSPSEPQGSSKPARQRDPKTGRFLPASGDAPKGDSSQKPVQGQSLPDEMIQKARYYNFSESDIQGMSPDELDQSLRLIDMYEMKQRASVDEKPSGEKSQQPPSDATDPQQVMKQGQQQKAESQEPDTPVTPGPDILKDLREAGYEDEVLSAFKAQADQIQLLTDKLSGIESGQRQAQEQEARAWESRAIHLIDEFGRSDLFGTSTGADDDQQRNMKAVLDELSELAGRGFPLDPFTAQRALNRVFGNQIVQQDQQNQTRTLQGQANQVMGSGSTTRGRDYLDPPNDNPADDPLMRKFAEDHGMHL